jgi:TolB-like protein/tetratricopeptide (TPR) repeat protein
VTHPVQRVGSFLKELSRRKVYRGTVLYVVLATGGLELLDILVPVTPLPDWSMQAYLVTAIVGLPVAVGLAWAYDLTSRGVVATEPRAKADPGEAGNGDGAGRATNRRTIAVLPFENLGEATDAEPFVLGLHDDILTELSRVSALTVISRSSVQRFVEDDRPLKAVADDLGVGTVVEGSLQSSGARGRLNVRVTDIISGQQLWADRFSLAFTTEDLFDVQREIARRILTALQTRLTPEEEERTTSRPTRSIEAYRDFVRGQALLETWSKETMREGIGLLMKAVELDPGYAPAWARLADAVSLVHWYNYPPVEGAPSPEEAVRRAMDLDPYLAETHVSMAIVLLSHRMRDGAGALRELRKAIELRPSYAYAHIWLAWVYLLIGKPETAIEPAERAAELDPLQPPARVFLSQVYLANARSEEALSEARRGRELQPGQAIAHFQEGASLHHLERHSEALEAYRRALDTLPPGGLTPSASQVYGAMAATAARMGDRSVAEEFAGSVDADKYPFFRGLALAALGEVDGAMEAFENERSWDQFETEALRYNYPEILGPLRGDARYQALLRTVNRSWGIIE